MPASWTKARQGVKICEANRAILVVDRSAKSSVGVVRFGRSIYMADCFGVNAWT